MKRQELAKKIFSVSHLTGEFKLRSGAVSSEYFDKYLFEAEPELLEEITHHMIALLPEKFDVLAGLEMGGIPIASVLSQKTGKPLAMVRKKAKEYGTMKLAEGAEIKGKKVVIIEDVITSAGQVIKSAEDMREIGADIDTALCVIDREAGGRDNLAAKNIELKALFGMSELKG